MDDGTERWLPIPGYEGFYEASDLGRIRSVPRKKPNGQPVGTVLKPWTRPDGHLMVVLCVNGQKTSSLVHRLTAITFIGAQPPGCEVCHNDGNPANNVPGNLRWGTRGDNVRDSVRHGTNTWAARTHCPQGHPYDAENTITGKRGNGRTFRACRICTREAKRRSDKRRRSKSLSRR
jgi:HNH endonuclease/NUMOD4 motif